VEGGRAFGSVEDAESAAGSCADVDESAGAGHAGGDGIDEGCEGGDFFAEDGGEFRVFVVDDGEGLFDGVGVDVGGGGESVFGGQVSAVGEWGGHVGFEFTLFFC